MRMLHISKMDDLVVNSMEILEPAPFDAEGTEREDGNSVLKISPFLTYIELESQQLAQISFSYSWCNLFPLRSELRLLYVYLNLCEVMFANEPIDLFILPGLAFDKSGRCLGRGGGYYDTFLIKYQELAEDPALSYSRQILEDGIIPITLSDVPIDALISSSGVIPISPAANEICSG